MTGAVLLGVVMQSAVDVVDAGLRGRECFGVWRRRTDAPLDGGELHPRFFEFDGHAAERARD